MEIDGFLYDGRSSARQPAILAVDATGMVLLPDGTRVDWRTLHCSEAVGSAPRYIVLPDGRRFETRDHCQLDLLDRRFAPGRTGRRLNRLEGRLAWTLAAAVLTVLVCGAGLRYGLPALARQAAFSLPASISESSSRQTLAALDRWLFEPSLLPDERRQQVEALFATLAADLPGDFHYRLAFRRSEEVGANAFALPNGQIIVTDQLVELAADPDALAGVLAHEIGHVRERHGLRRALQSSALPLVLIAVTGDLNAAGSVLAALPTVLVESHYSRRFEREADLFARERLRLQGRDPARLAELLVVLERRHEQAEDMQIPDWLRTHPASEERRALLRATDAQ